jgi:membrane-bound lytic murein transglycosylase B
MITRRSVWATVLTTGALSAATPAWAEKKTRHFDSSRDGSYVSFLAGIRLEAQRQGIRADIAEAALALQVPNARVLQLDRHQPEFTLTWAQYRARVISDSRLNDARESYGANLDLLTRVWNAYGVDPRVIVGIWGLESNFGGRSGSFQVVDALATLAFDGRRASFFRAELLNALRILNHGDVSVGAMLGSYAGAMGQPQFMPSSYLRYAVDFDGNGRRDIWNNRADVFGSVANYLAKCGWRTGEPWGQPVRLTAGIDPSRTGRSSMRPLGAWDAEGVRRADGGRFSRLDVQGALLLPDGAGGEAFMIYSNFNVIRRYNPSDFYALAVGLIGSSAA